MASSNELCSVFQTLVVLLQDLDKSLAFAWSKPTDKLNEISRVRVIDSPVNVNTNFVSTIDKFKCEAFQKFLFRKLILQRVIFETENLIVTVAQLRKLDQRILKEVK